MNLNHMPKLSIILFCLFFLLSMFGCYSTGGGVHVGLGDEQAAPPPRGKKPKAKGGPPSHAPAHGYRAKHMYHYYPSERVYYDTGRGLYFFLEGNQWRMSVSLPGRLHVQLGEYVLIGMSSDRPYTDFEDHQRKYPPGQMKKKKKKAGKW